MAKPIETEPTIPQEMILKSKIIFDRFEDRFTFTGQIIELLKANYWVQRAIYEKLNALGK